MKNEENVVVAHEDVYAGKRCGRLCNADEVANVLAHVIPTGLNVSDTVFLCIGTDRSTGDALGPLIGTYLTERGYTNVIGTLDDPTHAMNLAEKIDALPHGKTVIAIDACLGQLTGVGTMAVYKGATKPGAGVHKDLPYVGDYSITATVNVGGFMEYFVLQNTRLSIVKELAEQITDAITRVFPLELANKNRRCS